MEKKCVHDGRRQPLVVALPDSMTIGAITSLCIPPLSVEVAVRVDEGILTANLIGPAVWSACPDYQALGIGNTMSEHLALICAAIGKLYFSTTSHPSKIAHRRRSSLWRMVRRPGLKARHAGHVNGAASTITDRAATDRLTAGFQFVS